uniref:Uncharacterized protein n=1 Tax=viral metagenome TaxID=1070528 RepID=A0A6M3LIT3_9ZZZZ
MNSFRKWPTIIKHSRELRITNTEQLPHGTGAKYLETMPAHNGDYVAIAWRRKILDNIPCDHILVEF